MTVIRIVNSLGTATLSPDADITMSAGAHVSFDPDPSQGTVVFNCDVPDGFRQQYYQDLKSCIENHASSTLDNAGTPWPVDFHDPNPSEGNGYYVSKINDVSPRNGAFAIVGGKSFRWAPATAGLTVADVAKPDVDCLDYMRIAGYVTRLESVLDEMARAISGTPVASLSTYSRYGLYKQYQALRELWNYLVIRSMVMFDVQHQASKLYLRARLTNMLACDISVGTLVAGFTNGTYKASFIEAYAFVGSTKTVWTCPSANTQPMLSGAWTLNPPSVIQVPPGEVMELTAVFYVVGQGTASMAKCGKISRSIAPWLDKMPVITSGKVTSAGYLSWERTHFNPASYPSPVPSGLPPTGDGCTYKRSPGTVTFTWGDLSSVISSRPSLHLVLTCTQDKTTASFQTDFSRTFTFSPTDPFSAWDVVVTATRAVVRWADVAQNGLNAEICRIDMTNRHFHKGDVISLDIPQGWGASTDLERIKASCVWNIQAANYIDGAPKAGGGKDWYVERHITSETLQTVPVRYDSKTYYIDSIRTPPEE